MKIIAESRLYFKRLISCQSFLIIRPSSDQEWNQTLNGSYICGRGLEDIYLNRREQKMFIVFIRYITCYSLIFLVNKEV